LKKIKSIIIGILLIISILAVLNPVSAATINVNPGTGTLQAAVASASSGDTLFLNPGIYIVTSQIVLNKNLTIVGASKETVIIKPNFDTGGSANGRAWFLVSEGYNVTFNNITFDGDHPNRKVNICLYFQGSGAVENCVIKNIQYFVLESDGSGGQKGEPQGRGVSMYAPNYPTTSNTVNVKNNTFSNIGRIGIFCGTGSIANIEGNIYTGKGPGIPNTLDPRISFIDYGIEVGNGGQAVIKGNTITKCQGTWGGWSTAGIYVHTFYGKGSQAATITNNVIKENYNGIEVEEAQDPVTIVVVANYNDIIDNDEFGIISTFRPDMGDAKAPSIVDGRFNWWGTNAGPGSIHNKVSANVNYYPWEKRGNSPMNSIMSIITKNFQKKNGLVED